MSNKRRNVQICLHFQEHPSQGNTIDRNSVFDYHFLKCRSYTNFNVYIITTKTSDILASHGFSIQSINDIDKLSIVDQNSFQNFR